MGRIQYNLSGLLCNPLLIHGRSTSIVKQSPNEDKDQLADNLPMEHPEPAVGPMGLRRRPGTKRLPPAWFSVRVGLEKE